MNARGRATREVLLRATSELVRDVGYAQTTIRAVAQAAGIAEGTIYRHFPDKASLLLAAALEQHAPIVEEFSRLPERAGDGELVDVLAEALGRLQFLRETLLPLELAMMTDPELAAARSRAEVPADVPHPPQLLAAYLAAEQERGRLRADVDPGEAAVLLLVALFGLTVMPAGPPGADPALPRPDVRRMVELLLGGLAA